MRTRLIMSPCVRSSAHAGPGRVGGGATGAAGRAARPADRGERRVAAAAVDGQLELLAAAELGSARGQGQAAEGGVAAGTVHHSQARRAERAPRLGSGALRPRRPGRTGRTGGVLDVRAAAGRGRTRCGVHPGANVGHPADPGRRSPSSTWCAAAARPGTAPRRSRRPGWPARSATGRTSAPPSPRSPTWAMSAWNAPRRCWRTCWAARSRPGFVASCLTRLADKLDCCEADLKAALAGADQLYHDETPVPVNGGTGYVYAARADGLVWYGAHEHRSHAATDGFGILPRFAGVLVRDDWAGYHKYSDPGRGGKVTGVAVLVVTGPVVADEHAGEAGQDAKAVGGGVAAVLVRPVPDQAVGAGGVDVAGPAVDRHRRLVVVEPVGAGQRVLQVGVEAVELVGQPGQAGGDESGRHRAAQQVRQQRRGAFHADMAQVGDLGDGGADVRPVADRAGHPGRRLRLGAVPGRAPHPGAA